MSRQTLSHHGALGRLNSAPTYKYLDRPTRRLCHYLGPLRRLFVIAAVLPVVIL